MFGYTGFGVAALAAAMMTAAHAQDYPARPVRVVVPFSSGGPSEILGRLIGQKLTEVWGQQFIIDTRGGGGGTIGVDIVAKSAPDGYTVLLHTVGHVIAPALYSRLPYDAEKDFISVALAYRSQLLIVAHTSVPAKTVQELIALARSRPLAINYASSGNGGISHLAMHLFQTMAGVQMTHVPYKGMAPGLADVVAGQVQIVSPDPAVALPHVKSGRIHAIALTGAKRIPAAPQVPTVAESGLPGYEVNVWYAFYAPRGTPRAIVDKLNAGVVKAMNSPDIRERYLNEGAELSSFGATEFAEFSHQELVKWTKVVKDSGVRMD
jgi:tripartite-type tricarboxylate transporter receptor subunit TctC